MVEQAVEGSHQACMHRADVWDSHGPCHMHSVCFLEAHQGRREIGTRWHEHEVSKGCFALRLQYKYKVRIVIRPQPAIKNRDNSAIPKQRGYARKHYVEIDGTCRGMSTPDPCTVEQLQVFPLIASLSDWNKVDSTLDVMAAMQVCFNKVD